MNMKKLKPLIAGNWKMYKTLEEGIHSAIELKRKVSMVRDVEIAVFPPFPLIIPIKKVFVNNSNISVGAQDVSPYEEGAYTGDVSAKLLKSIGCKYVIVGHSERRKYHFEDDYMCSLKIAQCLKNGIIPILCIGETIEERERGETLNKVDSQIYGALDGFSGEEVKNIVIAYEPVWAIGTGHNATPSQAQDVHCHIRKILEEKFGGDNNIRILYGGSIKPDNVKAIMAEKDIDGVLVGGASLEPLSFTKIIKFKEN